MVEQCSGRVETILVDIEPEHTHVTRNDEIITRYVCDCVCVREGLPE
jgi:hypothetical protein